MIVLLPLVISIGVVGSTCLTTYVRILPAGHTVSTCSSNAWSFCFVRFTYVLNPWPAALLRLVVRTVTVYSPATFTMYGTFEGCFFFFPFSPSGGVVAAAVIVDSSGGVVAIVDSSDVAVVVSVAIGDDLSGVVAIAAAATVDSSDVAVVVSVAIGDDLSGVVAIAAAATVDSSDVAVVVSVAIGDDLSGVVTVADLLLFRAICVGIV